MVEVCTLHDSYMYAACCMCVHAIWGNQVQFDWMSTVIGCMKFTGTNSTTNSWWFLSISIFYFIVMTSLLHGHQSDPALNHLPLFDATISITALHKGRDCPKEMKTAFQNAAYCVLNKCGLPWVKYLNPPIWHIRRGYNGDTIIQ